MPRVPRSFAHLTEIDAVLGGVKSFAVVCARVEDVEPLLPDGCANLMPIDGPYHGVKGVGWDNEHRSDAEFLQWKGERYAAWKRILAPNGTLYDFASPRMGARVEVVCREHFAVVANVRWQKPKHSTKAEMFVKEDLRCPFPASETIVIAETKSWIPSVLLAARRRGNLSRADVSERVVGSRSGACWNWEAGIREPLPEHWDRLRSFLDLPPLENLRRPFNVTPDDQYTDVWTYPTVPHRRDKHPCEKPEAMARDIVRISSRPGDLVLVFFSGSGVFAVEALKQGRRAIAVEMDPRWAETTRARCEAVLRSLS